ncbi:helix-turn-helix domain-containing protein [Streptomyces sp. WI04-05B]|uniref:helix-turn-helix domain-containing protein n=1 Tax=Streptomyces TaxID=1883 RepID=UPI0029BF2F58|nr:MULTISPECIES: helix-turn-helix domain-containing protein [unclassified Streptomyces]MDX2544972.1 helix-turn-helix domain-containing protein [Streptomyces sp. WI04-05B]MDX2589020.1 helix-turn-helix domain-containing protein [Streptomyces sp. WI04-05A]
MGRRESSIDPTRGVLERFAHDLRLLRRQAGSPSYQQLAGHTHFASSTLAACASGKRLPSAAVLEAYVRACAGDVTEWESRRIRTRIHLDTSICTSTHTDANTAEVESEIQHEDDGHEDEGEGTQAEVRPAPVAASAGFVGQEAVRRKGRRGGGASWWRVGILALVLFGCCASQANATHDSFATASATPADAARWLNPRAAIPDRFRPAIIRAGTMCPVPQITPALVAAILAAESGFDPGLADPAAQEYGIARWTPRVLRYYLPPERQDRVPVPPFDPEDSILALGRMLCALAPQLEGVAGDPAMNLAAAYRTATFVVQRADGVPDRLLPYTRRVRARLLDYAPTPGACLPYEVEQSSYPAPCARSGSALRSSPAR